MALAISSLPVPFSPWMRMLASLAATLSTSSKSSCIFLLLPIDVLELVAVLQLRLQLLVLVDQRLLLDRLLELVEQALGVDRLLEEVEGAGLHRLDRPRDVALAGDRR